MERDANHTQVVNRKSKQRKRCKMVPSVWWGCGMGGVWIGGHAELA